jgi:hypothetical protein
MDPAIRPFQLKIDATRDIEAYRFYAFSFPRLNTPYEIQR